MLIEFIFQQANTNQANLTKIFDFLGKQGKTPLIHVMAVSFPTIRPMVLVTIRRMQVLRVKTRKKVVSMKPHGEING